MEIGLDLNGTFKSSLVPSSLQTFLLVFLFFSSLLFSLTPFVLLTNIVQTSWLSTSYYIFPCYSRLLDTICSLFHARSEFQTGFSESGTATRKYLFGSSFKKWFVSMFFFLREEKFEFFFIWNQSRDFYYDIAYTTYSYKFIRDRFCLDV